MRTKLVLATLGAVVAVLVVGAVILLRGGDDESEAPVLRGSVLATATTLKPQAHLFGQRVTARLDVVYNEQLVAPGSVKASPRFDPFRVVATRREQETFGDIVRQRTEYDLECLTNKCLSPKGGFFTFPRTGVTYRPRALRGNQIASVDWPQLRSASRIGRNDLEGLELEADVRELPVVTYTVDPDLVQGVGYSAAIVLGLAGLALLAYALGVPALVREALARRRARRSPLQRALALVQETTERGDREDSRRALDRLSAELKRTSEPDLAVRATGLAWRRSDPSCNAVDPLSDDVTRVIEQDGTR